MYHSEHAQDRYLNEHIFKGKRDGIFFECGAIDGILTSNTLFFERELGWGGICCEANPEEFKKLKENRKCNTVNYALTESDGSIREFMVCENIIGWSGLVDTMEPQHIDRIHQNVPKDKLKRIEVTGITLYTLLWMYHFNKIDYLSLDIEGGEYNVLMAFPFDRFDIRIMDIENNFGNHPIEQLMNHNGYKMIAQLGPSQIFEKVR